jgi:uroporphyrinogen-III decarboxylase
MSAMTAKQRIITALRHQQPDAVPVTLGVSEMVPVRLSGLSYVDFFWYEKRSVNRERIDCERSFGADVFMHSAEGPSPDDPPVTVEAISESRDEVVYREITHTPHGDLIGVSRVAGTESPAMLSGAVQDPLAQRDAVLSTLQHPDTKDFSGYLDDWNYVGDDGHCGFWIATPVDWWSILRGGPQAALYDFMDQPALIADLFAEYTRYAVALLDSFLRACLPQADSIGLGGSTTSMSVSSPRLLETHTLPFVRAIQAVADRYNVPTQYHMCGRSRAAIPFLAEAGVNGMDALECPPTGDVDLAEVKRLFGDRLTLRGNVNSITTMLRGAPQDVEREVIRCLHDAKEGGGYILGVGDQTPYWTPLENLTALVEAGRKYGAY